MSGLSAITRNASRTIPRKQRRHEERLRQAISLYHLSPSFYPVSGGSSSSSPSSSSPITQGLSGLDAKIEETLRHDVWGYQQGGELRGDAVKGMSPSAFHKADTISARRAAIALRGPLDGYSEDPPPLTDPAPIANESGDDKRAQLNARIQTFLSNRPITPAPSAPRPTFVKRTGQPTRREEIRDAAERARFIQQGASEAVRRSDLDERSARIRDALFGTVGAGEKPGLEVVRERAANRRK